MRVVCDTNVLVPITWQPSVDEAPIFRGWKAGLFELVASPFILGEVEQVLGRRRIRERHEWSDSEIQSFITVLRTYADLVEPSQELSVVRDEEDNRILEAAIAGEADYIVTVDDDLLSLENYGGVQIVSPGRFLAILRAQRL